MPATAASTAPNGTTVPAAPAVSEVVVYDLTNPAAPRLAGKAAVPTNAFPVYYVYCGGYFDAFWLDRLA